MLTTLNIRNHRSILDLTFDLTCRGRAPANWREAERLPFLHTGKSASAVRLAPVMAIYGANAAGKSNLIQAFRAFQSLLSKGVRGGAFVPNKLNRRYVDAAFAATCVLDGKRYGYEIRYDATRILSESLTEDGRDLFRVEDGQPNFSGIATAAYDAARLGEVLRVECATPQGAIIHPVLSRLTSALPGLHAGLHAVAEDLRWEMCAGMDNALALSDAVALLSSDDSDAAHAAALGKIAQYLNKFDIGIKGLSAQRERLDALPSADVLISREHELQVRDRQFVLNRVSAMHEDAEGGLVSFNFLTEESSGTKVIAGLLGLCLWALEQGKTLLVDELDRSVHPLVLVELVRLFTTARTNTRGARLIFTVHDTVLLERDLLRPTEVALVSKTLKGGTTLTRLCDFTPPPSMRDFRQAYLQGRYGGIPFPYI